MRIGADHAAVSFYDRRPVTSAAPPRTERDEDGAERGPSKPRGDSGAYRVLHKGATGLFNDVKDAVKDLLDSIDGEKHARRGARHLLRDFHRAVRSALASQRESGDVDPAAVGRDLESAFEDLVASLRETFGGEAPARVRAAATDVPLTTEVPVTSDAPSALESALSDLADVFGSGLASLLADLGFETPAAPAEPDDPGVPPTRRGDGPVDLGPTDYAKATFGVRRGGAIDTTA